MNIKTKILSAFIACATAVMSFGGFMPGIIPDLGESALVTAEENETKVSIMQTDIDAKTVSNYSKYANVSEVYYDSMGNKMLDCSEYYTSALYDGIVWIKKAVDDNNNAYEYLSLDGKVIPELSWDNIFSKTAPDNTEAKKNYYKMADMFFSGYAVVRPYGSEEYYAQRQGTHIINKKGEICYSLTDKEISDECYIKNIGSGQFAYYDGTVFTKIIDSNGKTIRTLSNDFSAVDTVSTESIYYKGYEYKNCYLDDISVEYSGLRTARFREVLNPTDQGDGDMFIAYLDNEFNVLPIRVMSGWAEYHQIKAFYDDYAVTVSEPYGEKKYGYMDKQGNMIIPEEYDAAYGYGNGLFAVGKDGKYGFLDKDNKTVIPLEYDDVTQFVDGVAYGVKDGKLVVFSVPTTTSGDINDDGVLNLYDVIEIAKSLIGMRTFTDEEKLIADYNHDGVVNLYDAIEVARTIMENIKES